MSRAVIFALGCGLLSAVLYASALVGAAGSLLLVFLVQLPLFVCGLSKEEGWIGAALAGAAGTAAMVLAGGPWAAGNFALAEAVPAILLSQRAGLRRPRPDGSVEWYPAGRLILWLTLYALAVLGGFMLLYLAAEGGLEGELRRGLAALLAASVKAPALLLPHRLTRIKVPRMAGQKMQVQRHSPAGIRLRKAMNAPDCGHIVLR